MVIYLPIELYRAREVLATIFTSFLFIIAGVAEVGGGYLNWLWLREGKPLYLGVLVM